VADQIPWQDFSEKVLPFGKGRSYGDSCLNDGGVLIDTARLNRIVSFDQTKGILRCESGTTFDEILNLIVPKGWFLPVSPGTRFISVGGAVANDIHGKNHHRAGTFGCHVLRFELLRSSGERLICSQEENRELFQATIGGLGLTGLILWAEFGLKAIRGEWIDQEIVRFHSLDEYFDLAHQFDQKYEYTVAWIDCLSKGPSLGRGLLMGGDHSLEKELQILFIHGLLHVFGFDHRDDCEEAEMEKWASKIYREKIRL